MLKLINIKKNYVGSDIIVKALKGISLNFRENEFVSILGASGCGKTTLLNIIGGLDKYSSGDLVINGISTKNYSDHDWDNYRNHSIGFVFQAYNLIQHQTVLGNVELALTISGVSSKERKQRAKDILKKVGLEGLEKKKPNQLSGGQMQRVAIARALVNNPDILLADEPTGALDTETSIQIMDLLKEVAKDRLVIMVTHNPDLAYKYSTRIVKISDGLIIDDSNPYEEKEDKVVDCRNEKKSSMSFFTAAGLSLSNLFAKIRRTILVIIASSIGIIGVSSVLAVSNGVKTYISDMQDDMLSSYPLTIEESSVDYTSLMTGLNGYSDKKLYEFDTTSQVGVDSMIEYLMSAYQDFTKVKTNDINEDLISYINSMDKDDVASISLDYGIDPTNNIFTTWECGDEVEVISFNGLTQRYIQELKTIDGFSNYASFVNMFTDFMNLLPDNKDYVLSQYDLLGNSKYASGANEIMIVVDSNTTLTDIVLAQLGLYNHNDFISLAQKAIEYNNPDLTEEERKALDEKYSYETSFNYEDIIGKELYYLPNDSIYSMQQITTKNIFGMNQTVNAYAYNAVADSSLLENATKIKISGILRLKDTKKFGCLNRGVYYNKEFQSKFMNDANNSNVINEFRTYLSGDKKIESSLFNTYVQFNYLDYSTNTSGELKSGNASALNSSGSGFSSLFSSLSGIDYLSTNSSNFRVMTGNKIISSTDDNEITSYTDENLPISISIYASNFESKDNITSYLDEWNSTKSLTINSKVLTDEDRADLTYSDTIGLIIVVVDTLIDTITIALVAFTSLSLLVSCFMIAVITYISVMERIKEIGVIRSLGGRKKDISRLFISETLISGLASGIFGILITYFLSSIANGIVRELGVEKIAILSPSTALIMIGLSTILSVLSGLIPSMRASNQDPVVALRSE